jgi:hypothetical protein
MNCPEGYGLGLTAHGHAQGIHRYNLTTTLTVGGHGGAGGAAESGAVEQAIGFRTFEFVGSVGNGTARHGGHATGKEAIFLRPLHFL